MNNNNTLIIVDIQPAYQKWFNFKIRDFTKYLNENYKKFKDIIFIYNGSEVSPDTKEIIKRWYKKNGLYAPVEVTMKNLEKSYGFFRDIMDDGYEEYEIVSLGKYLIQNKMYDVRDIPEETMYDVILDVTQNDQLAKEFARGGYSFYIPKELFVLAEIKTPIVLVGGGVNECLKEIELFLQMINKKYNYDIRWVY